MSCPFFFRVLPLLNGLLSQGFRKPANAGHSPHGLFLGCSASSRRRNFASLDGLPKSRPDRDRDLLLSGSPLHSEVSLGSFDGSLHPAFPRKETRMDVGLPAGINPDTFQHGLL